MKLISYFDEGGYEHDISTDGSNLLQLVANEEERERKLQELGIRDLPHDGCNVILPVSELEGRFAESIKARNSSVKERKPINGTLDMEGPDESGEYGRGKIKIQFTLLKFFSINLFRFLEVT